MSFTMGCALLPHLNSVPSLQSLSFFFFFLNMAPKWARRFFIRLSSKQHDLQKLGSMLETLPHNAEDQLIQFFQSNFPNQIQNQQPGTKPGFLIKGEERLKSLRNTGRDMEIGKIAADVLKTVGVANSLLCVLLFMGVILDRFLTVNTNDEKCIVLLQMMGTTLKSLKDFRKHFSQDNNDVLNKVSQTVLKNCIIFYNYLDRCTLFKIWNAKRMEEELRDAQQMLNTALISVNCVAIAEVGRTLSYSPISISNISEIESPVGLETHIDKVCKMLSMDEKDKPAVAVIIWGLGGMGKTTLAEASVQQLASSMSDSKFSRVVFDNTIESGRQSHVTELQQQLVNSLTGRKENFGNTKDGKCRLKQVLQCTSCFISIDNVNHIGDVEELLPQNLDLNSGTTLRILITSREQGVRSKLPSICRVEEHEVQPLPPEDANTLLLVTVMGSINASENFPNELNMLKEVQNLCCGFPILLHVIGRHLRDDRSLACYNQTIEELKIGDLSSYLRSYESVTDILLFVYKNMNPRIQDTFLHICNGFTGYYYFLSFEIWAEFSLGYWDIASLILGESAMNALQKKGIVKNLNGNIVIHDILRKMVHDEVKKYYLRNTVELKQALQENRKDIKGIHIQGNIEVEAKDLDVLHASLRVLCLNEQRINGKCECTFKELRSLRLGFNATVPFRSLQGFSNLSLLQFKDCNNLIEFPSDMCSLSSLRILAVTSCRNLHSLPSKLSSLTSLVALIISDCTSLRSSMEGKQLPQSLKYLEISHCPEQGLPTDLSYLSLLEECYLKYLRTKEGSVLNIPCHSNLKILVLSSNSGLAALRGDFSRLQNLRFLDVYGTTVKDLNLESFPNDIEIVPPSSRHKARKIRQRSQFDELWYSS